MLEFIKNSVEYTGWGYNILIFGAVGAFILTLAQSWGLYEQTRKIWKDRKADVLSVHWFGYVSGFLSACIPYGIAVKSLTILVSVTIMLFFHLLILYGIFYFRRFTLKESVGLALYSLMMPAMILLPWKDLFYLTFSLGTVWAMATQPWEMYKANKNGEIEIKMLITILINVTFWAVYAFAIEALALMILNPLLFVITMVTILLWLKNEKSEFAKIN